MSERLESTLDDRDAALWRQYLDLERKGVRKQALALLDEFVTALSAYPPERRAAFTRTFCALATAKDAKLPARQPLLVGVICPYLADASARGEISALRWMVGLHDRNTPLYECRHLFDPERFGTADLLCEILAQDPEDSTARRRLIRELAYWFDYSIHEVPAGVLSGFSMEGATIPQCHELLDELEEFRGLVETEGLREDYEDRICVWAFHFRGYANYLSNREEYESYADYIERHTPQS